MSGGHFNLIRAELKNGCFFNVVSIKGTYQLGWLFIVWLYFNYCSVRVVAPVMVVVVSMMESRNGLSNLHLLIDGSLAWFLMSSVEGCRVVHQVLSALWKSPHWQEELVDCHVRIRSNYA